MDRRVFNKGVIALAGGLLVNSQKIWSKQYLTFEQAKIVIWPDLNMEPFELEMTKQQVRQIKSDSRERVRNPIIKGLKSEDNHWLIADQVIGKHEFIDLAVGISNSGQIRGIEILTYRESYGDQVMNNRWRAQFYNRDYSEILQLDEQIKNISGATMSCSHITKGVNRLTQTWKNVLQYL